MLLLSCALAVRVGTARPSLIYGTAWKKDETQEHVSAALRAGFRAFDTANQPKHYREAELGAALRATALRSVADGGLGLAREDLWVQTKYTPVSGQLEENTPYDRAAPVAQQVKQSVFGAGAGGGPPHAGSLAQMGLGYLDSLLLHSPCATAAQTLEAWRAMEAAHATGAVRTLGVSNFNAAELQALLDAGPHVPISWLQNRLLAKTGWDREVRELCTRHGIVYQAFGVLTNNRHVSSDELVASAAAAHDTTPDLVLLRFAAQLDLTVLAGPKDKAHMAADVALLGSYDPANSYAATAAASPDAFALSTAELRTIESWTSAFDSSSPVAATFTHEARGFGRLDLFWLSSTTNLIPQGSLYPMGASTLVNTFHGHTFVAKDAASSTVLKRWRADAAEGANQHVVLDARLEVTFRQGRLNAAALSETAAPGPIELFYVGEDGAHVPQGRVEEGGDVRLTTTHGHRFVAQSTRNGALLWEWAADAGEGSPQVATIVFGESKEEL